MPRGSAVLRQMADMLKVCGDTELVSRSLTRKMCQMATKAQHEKHYRTVPALLRALREESGLSQRGLGEKLHRPQSWVYNCECGNRRVDVGEFAEWASACGVEPVKAFRRFQLERN